MCGIAGIIDSKSRELDRTILNSMCEAMSHRGPDDEGYYFNRDSSASVGLGHRRLSIIDLKTGHQPIHNENKNIWVIHNGEIYNFKDLKSRLEKAGHVFCTNSDAEVIVHAYEEYGDDLTKHFRGMFSFAIWDGVKKKLILARDRIGKKPLLYTLLNDKLIFASEFKALLRHPEIGRRIDYEAIHHYLTYLCIPAPLTAFKDIRKIPPAHILIYQHGKAILKKYWELDFSKKVKITEQEAVGQIESLLRDAVKVRLISDVPLGVLLSGGLDSSYVTALMKQLSSNEIRTFSVGFSENQFNELPYAELIANRFKTDHVQDYVAPDATMVLPELVERYGEPYADSSALPTYYVCKVARKRVKVVLNGDGGDEVFCGYRRHLAGYLAEKFSISAKTINRTPLRAIFNMFPDRPSSPNSPGNIRRFLDAAEMDRAHRHMRWIGFFSEELKRDIYTDEFNSKTKDIDSSIFLTELFSKAEGLDSVDAALYIDTMFGLQNDLLVKMDIASMANSLETRSPLLDQYLMEFSASLPSKFKIQNFNLKHIFKKSARGLLPEQILRKPKRGFAIPVDEWFRKPLKEYLIDTVLSERALGRGYFKVEKIKDLIEVHLKGKNNYGQHLWGLLMLELWHRRFIDT